MWESHGLDDQLQYVTNPRDLGKKSISTSYDDLLNMSCCWKIYACSSSMFVDTNLIEESKELKDQAKNFNDNLEMCYSSKATFEETLKSQCSRYDKSGIGFNKSKTINWVLEAGYLFECL